jgi:hypothetical protein
MNWNLREQQSLVSQQLAGDAVADLFESRAQCEAKAMPDEIQNLNVMMFSLR